MLPTGSMAHNITADQDDSNMDLGRFIQENTYARDTKKEISIGNIRLDIVRQDKDGIVIGEVKKTFLNCLSCFKLS